MTTQFVGCCCCKGNSEQSSHSREKIGIISDTLLPHCQNKKDLHCHQYKSLLLVKACVHYFYQIFIYSSNDSPSKTMKNVFYFI